MKRSIAFRLAIYYIGMLVVFALVVGASFYMIFQRQNLINNQAELEERAENIASFISTVMEKSGEENEFFKEEGDITGAAKTQGGGKNIETFFHLLNVIDDSNVWLVDSDLNLITSNDDKHEKREIPFTYADLPADAEDVVQQVFEGAVTTSQSFSDLMEKNTLTVGAPVYKGDGSVQAVLLLHSPVDDIDSIVHQGSEILIISIGFALVIGLGIAIIIARSFTKPLKAMKKMAEELAEGNYKTRNRIQSRDEFGQLAKTLNELSRQLGLSYEEHLRFQKMQEAFFSNISHELRTPVTVICGSLEALASGIVSDPETVAAYHQQMLSESLALKRLVNDLLELSRLQNTEFSLSMDTFNLCDVLNEVRRSAQYMARHKGIEVTLNKDREVYRMTGDYGRLRQMWMIVLDNAIKFSPEGALVSMTLKENQVMVVDRGCGIEASELPHIFERFYKTLSKQNADGTGLGLSVAEEIARRHGIDIEASSTLGEGTTFVFKLPKPEEFELSVDEDG